MEFERDLAPARYRGRVILASSSERRRRLLEEAGYDFRVVLPTVGEDRLHPQDARVLAESLAYAKARQVADKVERDLVIGADTVVSLSGEIIGKADSPTEARTILKRLAGTTHEVITGLCVVNPRRGERLIAAETTRVTMRNATDDEIEGYVVSGEGIGKAGAYAIQENGDRFIGKIDGSFTNVVGLPMEMLADMLEAMQQLIYRE